MLILPVTSHHPDMPPFARLVARCAQRRCHSSPARPAFICGDPPKGQENLGATVWCVWPRGSLAYQIGPQGCREQKLRHLRVALDVALCLLVFLKNEAQPLLLSLAILSLIVHYFCSRHFTEAMQGFEDFRAFQYPVYLQGPSRTMSNVLSRAIYASTSLNRIEFFTLLLADAEGVGRPRTCRIMR